MNAPERLDWVATAVHDDVDCLLDSAERLVHMDDGHQDERAKMDRLCRVALVALRGDLAAIEALLDTEAKRDGRHA